jgi:hypothetical protein
MARQNIGIGTVANDGTGDPLRTAFDKSNDNFIELYQQSGHASYIDTLYPNSGSAFTLSATTDTVLPINGGTLYQSEMPSDITEFYFSGGLDISSVSGTFVVDEVITGGTSGTTATIRELGSGTIEFLGNDGSFTTSETITGGTSGATATVDALRSGYITGRNNDNLDLMLYFKAIPSAVSQWLDIWIDIGGAVGELYRQTFSFPKGSGVERGILYALPAAYTRDTWEANGGVIYVRSDASLDIYSINLNLDRSYKARS